MKYKTLTGNTWGVLLRARALRTTRHQPEVRSHKIGVKDLIEILLVVILATLLFGAGVVQGWLRNVVGFVIGAIIVIALLLLAFQTVGEDETLIAMMAVGSALVAAKVWAQTNDPVVSVDSDTGKDDKSEALQNRDEVWDQYRSYIEGAFSPRVREEARSLYRSGDVASFEHFCRKEATRVDGRRARRRRSELS